MTADQAEVTGETLVPALIEYLEKGTGKQVTADEDLFASGTVSSMLAMQLVVHLEETYGIAIVGPDLKLANFRTVELMAALVLRLRAEQDVTGGA
ncbi:acyl carrier protein [Saccharomonospora piscinae]|uniref:Methoxymalonate biosynthesis protein n=1 Tax=Saccharomonospora piscinae TaxID=687388 RepID=A0A1V8ZY54_SACPI|nr:acyl carrier protein [Saccharomonospora piscinae]OQO89693.1 methoxymalonate biosynthesis protein [Saccharomonospora piscinae]TLW91372.1 acyl carrier protein [Saccharomonospora piscinae]